MPITKQLTTYYMKADMNSAAGRTTAYSDIGVMLAHLNVFGVVAKQIQFFADGKIQVTLIGAIPRDQQEHVGVDPETEVKTDIEVDVSVETKP